MATFQAQVEGITQLSVGTTPTTGELTQYLTDGAKEVITILPPHLLMLCSNEDTFNSTAIGSEAEALGSGKILDVFAGNYEARQISPKKKHKANLSTSIHYATASDPVFYIQNNLINVLPASLSCKYNEITYPAVAFGDSAISTFPDEAEYLVVLYGAMKTLVAHIGALTIPPGVTGDGATLTADSTALSTEQIGVDEEFLEFDQWFTALGEMIEDDEDIELASAQIEKINSYVNTWNIQLQGNLADFQRYSAILQSVKGDYMQGISMLKSGGMPQAQPQQQKGR
jgi:hypothetical protein